MTNNEKVTVNIWYKNTYDTGNQQSIIFQPRGLREGEERINLGPMPCHRFLGNALYRQKINFQQNHVHKYF
jgi:hypothetical protein